MRFLATALMIIAAGASAQAPGSLVDPMRGPAAIPDTTRPPRLTNWVNDDTRIPRTFTQQPPIIPHRVDGYQVDKNFNKCMDCHARERTEFSRAIPVSDTHYMNRDGKVLPHVSTRRYFCQQCHVAQQPMKPLIGNSAKGDPSAAPR